MAENAITAKNIKRNFGKFEALKGVTFDVPKGSVFGFLGPNGAGKTTTLYVLLGLLPPKEGQVSVLGYNPVTQGDQLRSKVGCLLEDPGLYEIITVKDNLEFFGRAQLMEESALQSRISELLEFFGLTEFAKTKAGKLSKGMKQKAALARAMLARPEILFLDEPTANLDPEASLAFRDLILELAKKHGITVFLNTHRLDEAQRICDHIAIIRQGNVLISGAVSDLLSTGNKTTVRIKADGITEESVKKLAIKPEDLTITSDMLTVKLDDKKSIPSLVAKCVTAGLSIYEVKPDHLSLEELFMDVMEGNHVA
jgi:ABC-2 type transport system ATP-binding protein